MKFTFCLLLAVLLQTTLNFQALQAFSITLDSVYLTSNLRNNHLRILKSLQPIAEYMDNCQAIGSISQMNLQGNPQSQFYMLYEIDRQKSMLYVDVTFRKQDGGKLDQRTLIVIDFVIGVLDQNQQVMRFNMTSFQAHIKLPLSNGKGLDKQLLFFLNGWNNLSMSGNVTYSFQHEGDVCTVHYMTHHGQKHMMGWRDQKDVLLFTIVFTKRQNVIQKFRIQTNNFFVSKPTGYQYFYGIKGTLTREFAGYFEENQGGVSFTTENKNKDETYALAFLPLSDGNFEDGRTHQADTTATKIIVFTVGTSVVVVGVVLWIFRRKILFSQDNFNEQCPNGSPISENSNMTGISNNKIFQKKLKMKTVEEVDQQFQGSLQGSCNPKVGGSTKIVPEIPLPE